MGDLKQQLISVIMPVYNAGDFLRSAIESILNQTYKNLELIIVNDASTDNTSKIVSDYKKKDKRIISIKNEERLGVSRSASEGILKSKGNYIARMDADDISLPDRLEKQVSFLQKNPKVVAIGGQCELIDSYGARIGEKIFPTSFAKIKTMIFRNVPLQQPALMVNRKLLPSDFVWYDENYSSAEELELLFKLFKFGTVRNLDSYVLKYRIHPKNTSLSNPKKTFYLTLKTRIIGVLKYGYVPTISGMLTTLMQGVFITLIPSKMIYPTYAYIRGMKKINLPRININFKPDPKGIFSLAKA